MGLLQQRQNAILSSCFTLFLVILLPVAASAQPDDTDIKAMIAARAHIDRVPVSLSLALAAVDVPKNEQAKGYPIAMGPMNLPVDCRADACKALVGQAIEPANHIRSGVRYLSELLQRYRGDVPAALLHYRSGLPVFASTDNAIDGYRHYLEDVRKWERRYRSHPLARCQTSSDFSWACFGRYVELDDFGSGVYSGGISNWNGVKKKPTTSGRPIRYRRYQEHAREKLCRSRRLLFWTQDW